MPAVVVVLLSDEKISASKPVDLLDSTPYILPTQQESQVALVLGTRRCSVCSLFVSICKLYCTVNDAFTYAGTYI